MKKSIILLSIFLLLALSLALPVFAHPGKTDANGGHYDHETGEYHYHHGYPAHQHYGGVCPYDYDDKTGSDARPSTGLSSHSSSSSSSTTKETIDWEYVFGIIGWIALIGFFGLVFVYFPLKDKRNQ